MKVFDPSLGLFGGQKRIKRIKMLYLTYEKHQKLKVATDKLFQTGNLMVASIHANLRHFVLVG